MKYSHFKSFGNTSYNFYFMKNIDFFPLLIAQLDYI